MAELKTKPVPKELLDVDSFIHSVADPQRRQDAAALLEMMRKASPSEPVMWGTSIIGFGSYHYRYASGHEGETCLLGFSPRKEALTLYLSGGLPAYEDLLQRLGKHKTGKGCLYIRRLEDVDRTVLAELLKRAATAVPKAATPPSGS